MHLHSAEPDAPGDFRVRQADPQHLYLRYLRDPQLQRNVHRSQNRIESYHQLRSAIAQVGGKKEITGKTDIEIEISNQCARLIANAITGPPKSGAIPRLTRGPQGSLHPRPASSMTFAQAALFK